MEKIDKKLIKLLKIYLIRKYQIYNLKINSFEDWDSVNHFYILLEIEKYSLIF